MNARLLLIWTLFAGIGFQVTAPAHAEGLEHTQPAADPSAPVNQGRDSVREDNRGPLDLAPADPRIRERIVLEPEPPPLQPKTSFTIEVEETTTTVVRRPAATTPEPQPKNTLHP